MSLKDHRAVAALDQVSRDAPWRRTRSSSSSSTDGRASEVPVSSGEPYSGGASIRREAFGLTAPPPVKVTALKPSSCGPRALAPARVRRIEDRNRLPGEFRSRTEGGVARGVSRHEFVAAAKRREVAAVSAERAHSDRRPDAMGADGPGPGGRACAARPQRCERWQRPVGRPLQQKIRTAESSATSRNLARTRSIIAQLGAGGR